MRVHHIACGVLLVSLGLTGVAFYLSRSYIQTNVQQRFRFQTEAMSALIGQRLLEYEIVLRSGAGLLSASDKMDRAEWHQFVSKLFLQQKFPGSQGLGYSQFIEPGQLARHVAEVRAQGFPGYSVWPEGVRDSYTAIVFLEPLDARNQRAIGYDMFSDATRRDAMEQARDTGQITLSARVTLVQETNGDVQNGFLMYMPVYKRGMPSTTVQERRAAILGFVYSPFRVTDFMTGTLDVAQSQTDIALFEGNVATPQSLLYQNDAAPSGLAPAWRPNDALSAHLRIPGKLRQWTLAVRTRPGYFSDIENYRSWRIAFGGVIIDLFLFYLLVSIGRQKRALNKLSQQLKAQLQETELVLMSAVETIGEAFVVYDPQDRLVFCNDEYRQFYATSAPVIEPGRTFEEIIRYGALRGQYQDATGRVDAWVAERLAIHQQGNTELIQHLEDGRWLKIRERKTPSGHIAGFRVDVTELYQAKQAAEVANRAKSQFLATMSHEIRTPMNAILGMSQVLLTPELSEDDRQDCARTILRSGQTLLALLNDVLDISKVESGKFELQVSAFSPVELVREVVQLFAAPAHLKRLSIRVELSLEADLQYLADSSRLRQMLSNLIGNALKFTERGEICVALLALQDCAGAACLEFSVTDTGIGIAQDQISSLFEPFSQGDSSTSRQYGGTGLGLSLVRKFARWMGGDVGATSDAGVGSRFWFRIPAQSMESVAPATPAASSAAAGDPLPRFTGHVLVAEDEPLQQKVVLAALGKLGLTVRVAGNGQQALDLITAGESFDLILMDLSMPVLNGLEATALIRLWQKEHHRALCPILAITADAFEEDRRRCDEAGMDGFLAKPVDFRELATTLAQWLPVYKPTSTLRAPAALRAVDGVQLVAALDELVLLLMQRKFDAFGRFKVLKSSFANTEIADELDEIEKGLNMMEFEQVIQRLHQLAQSQGRNLSI